MPYTVKYILTILSSYCHNNMSIYIDKLDGQTMRCIKELCETLTQISDEMRGPPGLSWRASDLRERPLGLL